MEALKHIHETIVKISKEELQALIAKRENQQPFTTCECLLFLYYDPTCKKYLAVDNQLGNLFIEEFKIKEDAFIWLLGLKEAEPLQKAEEQSFWW